METALILAQTVFYFSASAAIIAIGALSSIALYCFARIIREIANLFGNLNRVSSEAGELIKDIIYVISNLPIFSYFIKKRAAKNKRPQ